MTFVPGILDSKTGKAEYYPAGKYSGTAVFNWGANDKYENDVETINSIEKYCEENLAKYMLPKKFIVIKEFPKTMIGKIDYKELEKMYKGEK